MSCRINRETAWQRRERAFRKLMKFFPVNHASFIRRISRLTFGLRVRERHAERRPARPRRAENWREHYARNHLPHPRPVTKGAVHTMTSADKIKSQLDQSLDDAKPLVDKVLGKTDELAQGAKERVELLAEKVMEKAEPLIEKVKEKGDPLVEKAMGGRGNDSTSSSAAAE